MGYLSLFSSFVSVDLVLLALVVVWSWRVGLAVRFFWSLLSLGR